MKSVAAHVLRLIFARQGETSRDPRHGMMESRVETGDLRQVRPRGEKSADGREIVRLVQRRKGVASQGPPADRVSHALAWYDPGRHARCGARPRSVCHRQDDPRPIRQSSSNSGNSVAPAQVRSASGEPCASLAKKCGASPSISSTSPLATSLMLSALSSSNKENLILDEPALNVRTASATLRPLTLKVSRRPRRAR